MVYVGLVTGRVTPRARQAPRMNVVLPEPSSPETSTRSPGRRLKPRRAPSPSVSSGDEVTTFTQDSSEQPRPGLAALEQAQLNRGLGWRGGDGGLGGRRRLQERPAEQLGDAPEVILQNLEHPGRVKGCRRVVERIEEHAPAAERHLLLLAVNASDPRLLPREELGGEVAKRRDERWLDQLNLAEQVALAGLDLVRHRVAVPGRPAFQDVRDVDVASLQADAGQKLIEQLPCLADERKALLVLVEARRLADEHQLGVRVTHAEHDLRAVLREPTALAAGRLLPQLFEARKPFDRVVHRSGSLGREADGRSVAAAGAATAAASGTAAPAAEALLSLGAVRGEHGQLAFHLRGAAVGTGRVPAAPDKLLEVRLALHAHVLVDRHGPQSTSQLVPSPPTYRGRTRPRS